MSLIALALGLRRREPRASAVFLPLGMALSMLLGAAATAGFALRYLVPLVPEFAIAATLSIELLSPAAAAWWVRRASHLEPREADRR
jgi:hypothetical protein